MPRGNYDSDLDDRPRRRARRRRPGTNLAVVLVCVGAGLLLLLLAAAGVGAYILVRAKPAADPSLDAGPAVTDLERLAGGWECTFRDPAGRVTMRKVKLIVGTTETATWYRPDGTVFRVNRVEFRLEARGRAPVFRYFNGWVVDGPGAGQPFPGGEYEYTLDGDTWTEFDPGGPIVWTRRR